MTQKKRVPCGREELANVGIFVSGIVGHEVRFYHEVLLILVY